MPGCSRETCTVQILEELAARPGGLSIKGQVGFFEVVAMKRDGLTPQHSHAPTLDQAAEMFLVEDEG